MTQILVEKALDPEGRLLIPKAWRKSYGRKVIIIQLGKELRIRPKEEKSLSELPDLAIDVKTKPADWHAFKAEVYKRRA